MLLLENGPIRFPRPLALLPPHFPKKRCVRRTRKTPSMTGPVTASYAITPLGGVSGVTPAAKTRRATRCCLRGRLAAKTPEDGRTSQGYSSPLSSCVQSHGSTVSGPRPRPPPRCGLTTMPPAEGPLAPITRAGTRPQPCRSGDAPVGRRDPCPLHLPAYRPQRGRTLRAAGEAPCAEQAGVKSQPAGHQPHRCLAPCRAEVALRACSGTQYGKPGSASGARGRILTRRARLHFTVAARSCCHAPQ